MDTDQRSETEPGNYGSKSLLDRGGMGVIYKGPVKQIADIAK